MPARPVTIAHPLSKGFDTADLRDASALLELLAKP